MKPCKLWLHEKIPFRVCGQRGLCVWIPLATPVATRLRPAAELGAAIFLQCAGQCFSAVNITCSILFVTQRNVMLPSCSISCLSPNLGPPGHLRTDPVTSWSNNRMQTIFITHQPRTVRCERLLKPGCKPAKRLAPTSESPLHPGRPEDLPEPQDIS